MIATAVAAVKVRGLISSVFLLGAFSFFLAVLWAALNAADVSFTEAMVGAGASTIFLVVALFETSHVAAPQAKSAFHPWGLLLCVGLGALFIWGSFRPSLSRGIGNSPEFAFIALLSETRL